MKKFTLWIVAVLAAVSATAQGLNPMSPMPEDPAVRKGTLENGMSYFIRHNEKPKNQAEFYILHHVGAIQEEDSQQGLAHFLEHMAFNGTKNLPGKQIIEYLETVGVKFGANLNAYTSWDETCYNISAVPTTREGIIDSAMLILHDWSHFIALQPKEIDSERGVIKEELRTRDGAQWRAQTEMLKALGHGTRYAERNLIGHLDGLQNFAYHELEDFYQKWYRPEYQAIVIVGDIDVNQIEGKLKMLMSDIPASSADVAQKETIVVPNNEEPIISIFTDPEMTTNRAQIFIKRPALPKEANNTVYAEMLSIIDAYFSSMAQDRLTEITMQPDAPFIGGAMQNGSIGIIPTLQTTILAAVTKDGGLARGIEAILTEMERVRRYGFTHGEFERAQNDLLRSCERQYANRNDNTNGYYVQRYLNAYRANAAFPGPENEAKIDSMLIKSLNVEAINQVMKQYLTDQNQVIILNAPQKEGVAVPTKEEILAIRKKVIESEIEPYKDNVVKEPLIAEDVVLKGSPVKKSTTNEAYGTTEWTLKNGIKVVVKPTKYKADEIQFFARAYGGSSVLKDEEMVYGEVLPLINQMSGVGKFSRIDLQKQLSGIFAHVSPSVSNYTSQLSGSCSPKDLETMLQLLYLHLTQPRFDEKDYATTMTMIGAQLENIEKNPDFQMEKHYTKTVFGDNPRRQPITKEALASMQFEQLAPIYGKLFPDGNSFTYFFVGNVELETLKPLVEKYIGSLPVSKKTMQVVEDNCYPVKGQIDEMFRVEMQQPKVSVRFLLSGSMPFTFENRLALTFLTQALNSSYLVSIREEKGGTYGVHVSNSTGFVPKPTYELTIQFDTNDQMADELCEIVLKEIETIANEGPKTEDVEKTREFLLKSWKSSLEQNASWMSYVSTLYSASGLDYLAHYEATVKAITNADIQALMKKILNEGNLIKVVMRPSAE